MKHWNRIKPEDRIDQLRKWIVEEIKPLRANEYGLPIYDANGEKHAEYVWAINLLNDNIALDEDDDDKGTGSNN